MLQFTFTQLCIQAKKPASDYIKIADHIHSCLLGGISQSGQ